MNSSELVEKLAIETGLDKTKARKAVDAFVSAVVEAAKRGDTVALSGFGQFKVKDTPAREGRNPGTGAAIAIAASRKLTFVPGKALKADLNPVAV